MNTERKNLKLKFGSLFKKILGWVKFALLLPWKALRSIIKFTLTKTRQTIQFLTASFKELRQVTWLSRRDTIKFSSSIIIFVALSATIIALVDLGLYKLVVLLTNK